MLTAFVTGASSGFGMATASLLADAGYRVFGTSRTPHPSSTSGVEMLTLDVRSDASVKDCIERLLLRTDRVDLLINNAGQIHVSVVEETSIEQARDVMETNFWGAVRVTNALLPLMRRQREGRIINVSSLSGLVGIPGQAFYSASKFALEGYTEALSFELEPFHISVSLVEPGFFRTSLHKSTLHGAMRVDEYAKVRQALEVSVDRAISQGDDPQKVAEAIVGIARAKSPRLRYRVGSDAVWVPRLKSTLPNTLFRIGLRRRFNM